MSGRRKWVQRLQEDGTSKMVEVDMDVYITTHRNTTIMDRLVSESHYEGMQATDGTPIDTRAKHKRYMKEHGVCHAGDFTPEFLAGRRKEIARDDQKERLKTVRDTVTRLEVN